MLRVTIAEVQRSALKQFGINLGAAVHVRQSVDGLVDRECVAADGCCRSRCACRLRPSERLLLPRVVLSPARRSAPLQLQHADARRCQHLRKLRCACRLFGRLARASRKRCAPSNGMDWSGRLAEPNLTAVSGETAKFLAGGEYPFPAVDSLGALSVTFKEFGVGLSFTPVVLSEGRISIKVETEVSELDSTRGLTIGGSTSPASRSGRRNRPSKCRREPRWHWLD